MVMIKFTHFAKLFVHLQSIVDNKQKKKENDRFMWQNYARLEYPRSQFFTITI